MDATKKNTQVFVGPVLEEGRLKSIKTIIPSYFPGHGEFENLCFCSPNGVCVTCICLQV